MKTFELTAAAEADLTDILLYIADEGSEAAVLRLHDRFQAAFDMLSRHPRIGHPRPDSPRPLPFWSVGSYMLAYMPHTRPLRIVAILHGAHDFAGLLDDRDEFVSSMTP